MSTTSKGIVDGKEMKTTKGWQGDNLVF